MNHYINELDPFASKWLKNLFPNAVVDARSIKDVQSVDVEGFKQCHFFGGIGGWEYALRLAGWPSDETVWTGSCPCQPYSQAGKQKGDEDPRNLWPEFRRLIAECHPSVVFGEQVSSAIGHGWLDGVFADLEKEGYSCGAVVLGAHSVGAPHIRQRLYWVANSEKPRRRKDSGAIRSSTTEGVRNEEGQNEWRTSQFPRGACNCSSTSGLADSNGGKSSDGNLQCGGEQRQQSEDCRAGWRGDTKHCGREGREPAGERSGSTLPSSPWDNFDILPCTDGKTRRVESGTFPLAHGVPNRVGKLRGYGNAIVPQVAATFIAAFLDTLQ